MQTKTFTTEINASREKVWHTLWDDATYGQWTSAFSESSYAKTDWKKGSKVLFVDATGSGMVSVIEDKKENEFISFKHLGMLKDGVEDTSSDDVKSWSGSIESYTLTDDNGKTNLKVSIDLHESWIEFFMKTWPSALEKLKAIAEAN